MAGRLSVKFWQLSIWLPISVKIPCRQETCQLLSTFCAVGKHSVNFLNFLCGQKTFRQLSVWPGDLQSTFSNFPCDWETFHQLSVRLEDHPLTFFAAGGPFTNFRQLSVWPVNLTSSSVYFMCRWPTFC